MYSWALVTATRACPVVSASLATTLVSRPCTEALIASPRLPNKWLMLRPSSAFVRRDNRLVSMFSASSGTMTAPVTASMAAAGRARSWLHQLLSQCCGQENRAGIPALHLQLGARFLGLAGRCTSWDRGMARGARH